MSSSDQPQAPPPPRPSPHETEAMPTPLTKLEFSYAGTSWPLADFVAMVRSQQKVPQDLRAYQGKEVKRALKQGAKRQDLGPPPPPGAPGSQSWRDIVHEAATLPAPPQPVAITSFTAEELARSLVLSGTSRHRDDRVVLEDLLKEMEEINWKGWGNPFTVEITRENAVEMGVPDYFLICKKSRSLAQMRRCYETDPTYSLGTFREDMEIMLTNACTFNRPGEPVHNMSVDLRARFNALVAERVEKR